MCAPSMSIKRFKCLLKPIKSRKTEYGIHIMINNKIIYVELQQWPYLYFVLFWYEFWPNLWRSTISNSDFTSEISVQFRRRRHAETLFSFIMYKGGYHLSRIRLSSIKYKAKTVHCVGSILKIFKHINVSSTSGVKRYKIQNRIFLEYNHFCRISYLISSFIHTSK